MPSRSNFMILTMWISLASVLIQMNAFTPLAGSIARDFLLNNTQIGLIQTALFLPYSVLQIVAGLVIDRYPSMKVIALSTAVYTIASVSFAVSTTYLLALVFRAIMGIAMAFVFVPSTKLIMSSAVPQGRGKTLGIFMSSASVGSIMAAIAPVPIAGEFGGWRVAIVAMNIVGVASLILLLITKSEFNRSTKNPLSHSISFVLRKAETWVLGYDQMIRFGVATVVTTWIPTFVIEAHNFSAIEGGLMLGAVWVPSLATIPLGGLLSDRVKGSYFVIELAFAGLVPSIIVLGITTDYYLLWVSALCVGALMYFHPVPLFAIVPKIYGEERLGLVTGIGNTMASAAGFIFPPIFGLLKDTSGSFIEGWFLLSVTSLIGALVTMSLKRY